MIKNGQTDVQPDDSGAVTNDEDDSVGRTDDEFFDDWPSKTFKPDTVSSVELSKLYVEIVPPEPLR